LAVNQSPVDNTIPFQRKPLTLEQFRNPGPATAKAGMGVDGTQGGIGAELRAFLEATALTWDLFSPQTLIKTER
jgi:hypothetical protein